MDNYRIWSNNDPLSGQYAVSCCVISKSAVFKFAAFQTIIYFVIVCAVLSFLIPSSVYSIRDGDVNVYGDR
jgi:hypothetical protein